MTHSGTPFLSRGRHLALLALLAALAGCGGGDNADAGGQTAFNIVPTSITLTGPDTNTCGSGDGGRVYIYGGAGPYRIYNSGAATANSGPWFSVSKTQVDNPGGYFEVLNIVGCMTNVPVTVVDQLGRQAVLSVSSAKGS